MEFEIDGDGVLAALQDPVPVRSLGRGTCAQAKRFSLEARQELLQFCFPGLRHDEAALASTREQHQLLHAIEASGARLIEVGDPRQSQPVGAAGLWSRLEQAARDNDAQIELTRCWRLDTAFSGFVEEDLTMLW